MRGVGSGIGDGGSGWGTCHMGENRVAEQGGAYGVRGGHQDA